MGVSGSGRTGRGWWLDELVLRVLGKLQTGCSSCHRMEKHPWDVAHTNHTQTGVNRKEQVPSSSSSLAVALCAPSETLTWSQKCGLQGPSIIARMEWQLRSRHNDSVTVPESLCSFEVLVTFILEAV